MMRPSRNLPALLLLLLAMTSAPRYAAAQEIPASDPGPQRLHLLVLGIDDYGGIDLSGAVNDAQALARSLAARFRMTTSTHVLLNGEATRAGVDEAMQAIIAAAQPQDVFVFFFAGHGAADGAQPHLILPGPAPLATVARPDERQLIVPRLLRTWLNVMPARQQVVIIDAVNGAAFFHALQGLDLAQRAADPASSNANLAVITVAGMAYETRRPDGSSAGALTYALTETLGDSSHRSVSSILAALPATYEALQAGSPATAKQAPLLLHLGGADFALGESPAEVRQAALTAARAEAERRQRAEAERAVRAEIERRQRAAAASERIAEPSSPLPPPSAPPPPPPPQRSGVALANVALTVDVSAQLDHLAPGAAVFVNGQPAQVTGSTLRATMPLDSVGAELLVRVVHADGTTEALSIPVTATRGLGVAGGASRRTAPAAVQRRSIALLFATNDYDHEKDLRNPVFDAEAIGKELAERYGFDVRLVVNATRRQVMDTLDHYASRAGAEADQLLVFFAGHGSYNERHTFDGYIVARDTKSIADDPFNDTAVQYNWIRRRLANATSRHVLLMLDVCYGGSFNQLVSESSMRSGDEDPMYRSVDLETHLDRTGSRTTRRYLTAGGIERVPDGRPGEHSPFARRFLESLRTYGGSRGFLTLADIHASLQSVNPEPRGGGFDRDEPGSDFVFVPAR